MLAILIALFSILVAIVVYAAWYFGLFSNYIDLEDDDFPDDDDYDDDDYDDDDYDDDEPDSKVAVEVNSEGIPREFGPMTFEVADMSLRLMSPHLFADDWYENCRREFSRHCAEEWRKIYEHRRDMGLAA